MSSWAALFSEITPRFWIVTAGAFANGVVL
jgi:hypothetical protein